MAWELAERTQTNKKTGAKRALINGEWVPISKSQTNKKTGAKRVIRSMPNEERTQYGQDVFNDAQARTSRQPSQLELNKGDGNFQGSFTGSMLQGGRDILDAGAQMMYNAVPESVQQAGNQANDWLAENTGLVGKMPEGNLNYKIQQDEANYQEQRRRAGRGGFDGGRLLGNVLATAPLLAAKPFQMVNAGKDVFGAANLARGAGQGGVFGASQPVLQGNFWDEKQKQIGFGAGAGAGGTVLGNMLSRVVRPNTRESVTRLQEQGVTPTPGGILGGGWQVLEDKATSLPIVGTAISAAKKKAQEELNRAAYKRALVDTGVDAKTLPIGPEGILKIKETLSSAYKELWPKLTFKRDAQFNKSLAKLKEGAIGLTDSRLKIFNRVIKDLDKKISPNGSMLGETYQVAEKDVAKLAANYIKSPGSDYELGMALRELQNLMRQQLNRNNPEYAKKLDRMHQNWANYEILNKAGSAAGDQAEHGFTAANLGSAVRTNKKYNPKGAYGTGEARMQDLSSKGINALGSKYPDSGTAGRALQYLSPLAGAYSVFNPAALPYVAGGAAALGASSLPYLARKTTANILTKRPQSAQAFARALRKVSPALGAGGAVGSQ